LVDFARPAVYAAFKVADFLKALPCQVGADLRAADSVMTHHDRFHLRVKRRRPLVEPAEGQQLRALKVRDVVLMALAHVYDEHPLATLTPLVELCR
jgi:hypothetical protein